MKIIFPFPPRELNPNANCFWKKKAQIKIKYRTACLAISPKMRLSLVKKYPLRINFYPPRNIGDIDNMLASIKSGLDALAASLEINDKQFRPILIDVPHSCKENPRVEIILYDGKKPLDNSDKLSDKG